MTGYRILVADDDILILTTLTKGLRQAGYEVIAASSGEEAVRLGCSEAPVLAILDIRMPGIQGIEAAGMLREQAGIDSIFLSAYSDREVVEAATKEGALGYLVKPVDTHQLIPTIEAALERSADLQRLHENESNLTSAIKRSREISVAIGIYMERFDVTEQMAFETLRAYARSERCKLAEIARRLVQATEEKNDLVNKIHQGGERHPA
ncbi:MAG: response regulator [Candidatus Sedimenticola sp. (ex Thyasira tokunagai)]